MNAKAARATPAAEVVGEILRLPVEAIEVSDRLRPIDPVWAGALGGIIAAEGQKTPIEVSRLPVSGRYRLVAGGHRLAGACLAGLATIDAIVVGANALEWRAREISENLWRKGLEPVDRAAFIAELYALQKARAGLGRDDDAHALVGQARRGAALKAESQDASVTVTLAFGWADGVAEQIGLSRKTIYRDLELHRGLAPDVAAQLRGHPLAANAGQLRALARMAPEDQREAVAMILAGTAKTPAEARDIVLQRPKPSPEVKAWSAFFGSWTRMSAARRREALTELSKIGLPKGCRIVFDGECA